LGSQFIAQLFQRSVELGDQLPELLDDVADRHRAGQGGLKSFIFLAGRDTLPQASEDGLLADQDLDKAVQTGLHGADLIPDFIQLL
jgi:hypothetical protein